MKMLCIIFTLLFSTTIVYGKEYCQPGNSCWPNMEEIEVFKSGLSDANECLINFPTFTSKDEQGDMVLNEWFEDMPYFITPHELLNLRNYIKDNKAYFVILARNDMDVSKAVQFSAQHNLAFSVFGTGHEFQDRNSGPGLNGLLIRTICLRKADIDLDPTNHFKHPDGVIRLGAGMTWGTSKYKMKGVQEIAMENERVVVTGHAAEVGIVGWCMGGGHSPLGPIHGLGVDQMLEVELIGADGSFIIANNENTTILSADHSKVEILENNNELFWALRGGGAGPWGAVTAITFKLHIPRDECKTECYVVNNVIWSNNYFVDEGYLVKNLTIEFLHWAASSSKYWSGYFAIGLAEDGNYYVSLSELMYIGKTNDDDSKSLNDTFGSLHLENMAIWDTKIYDTYFDKTQNQLPESVYASGPNGIWTSVLLNSTVLTQNAEKLIDTLGKNWLGRCLENENMPCVATYMFHLTWPKDDNDITDTSLPKKTRDADLHLTTSPVFNLKLDLTPEEEFTYIHEVLSPQLYQFGDASYYSESEYTMEYGQWQQRFWDQETYEKLVTIKHTWDPEHVFECRHCVGEGEKAFNVGPETLPSWRYYP